MDMKGVQKQVPKTAVFLKEQVGNFFFVLRELNAFPSCAISNQ